MKRILLILILFSFFKYTYSFMPSNINDYTIGRVDKIEFNNLHFKITFDNFIYYHIYDNIRILQEKNTFINEFIEINDYPKNFSIGKGDIVAIDSRWSGNSSGILKISCNDGIMNIVGTKNKYFGTGLGKVHSEFKDDVNLNDDKLLKKLNETIGCNDLYTFFEKDRRFQDLSGNNILNYLYNFIYIIILIFVLVILYTLILVTKKT